jgi:hypothetical protein
MSRRETGEERWETRGERECRVQYQDLYFLLLLPSFISRLPFPLSFSTIHIQRDKQVPQRFSVL